MPTETFEKLPKEKRERIINTGIQAFSRNPYKDVSTDSITKQCQISKGLLFHYFGSKKQFYLYCLKTALDRLTQATEAAEGEDFYGFLFSAMDRKMELCQRCREEMYLVNMASRDASPEIEAEKTAVLRGYAAAIHRGSEQTLEKALRALDITEDRKTGTAVAALHLYINALLNRYLLQYQQDPDAFFENREAVQEEMKAYLDVMLQGICG